MKESFTLTEKEGKKVFILSDGSEVLVENYVTTDPQWVNIKQAANILNCSDRWARDLSVSNRWTKAYAEKNNRPLLHLKKSEVDEYAKSHVQVTYPATPKNDEATTGEGGTKKEGQNSNSSIMQELVPSTGISLDTKKDLEVILKHISPHIEEFVATHKSNQERIIALQEKNIVAEKKAVFWKTSTLWITIFSIFILSLAIGLCVVFLNKETSLTKINADLNGKNDDTLKELYDTKEQKMQLEMKLEQQSHDMNKQNNVPLTNTTIKE